MKDTTPEAEAEFRRRVMAKSPEERLKMACDMFSTAKKIAEAGILAEEGPLEKDELRRRLYERIYGEPWPGD